MELEPGRVPPGVSAPPDVPAPPDLLSRAEELAAGPRRRLLGLAGAPGCGKSTLAAALAARLGPGRTVVIPMDGFHLADAELYRLGRHDRKGAPDTFDRAGFVAALARLRAARETVYLPEFHREIEDSIAGAVAVEADIPLLIVEGNYLLVWPEVRALLDECWYLEPPDVVRLDRLVERHRRYGRDEQDAMQRATGSDARNAELIAAGRDRADRIVDFR